MAKELRRAGPRKVIIKTGALGATAVAEGSIHVQLAPWSRSWTQSGSATRSSAGYLAEWLTAVGPTQRLAAAWAMGAYAVIVPGDCELLPTRAELFDMPETEDAVRARGCGTTVSVSFMTSISASTRLGSVERTRLVLRPVPGVADGVPRLVRQGARRRMEGGVAM